MGYSMSKIRRLAAILGVLVLAGIGGCAVVPANSVVYEDASGYDDSRHSPDVVIIDRGPVFVPPPRWGYRHHRHYRHGYRYGHRSHGRSSWRGRRPDHGRAGGRRPRPDHGTNRSRIRPSPDAGRPARVIPRKGERRASGPSRGGGQPGRSPARRGRTPSGPQGESS